MKTPMVFGLAVLVVFMVFVYKLAELRAAEPKPLWVMRSAPSAEYEIMFHPADSTVSRKFYSVKKPSITGNVIEFVDTNGDEQTACGCWLITKSK